MEQQGRETAIAGLISELNIIDENELAKIKYSEVKNLWVKNRENEICVIIQKKLTHLKV